MTAVLTIDGHDVQITNPDKPYFARDVKLTKLELVQYYLSVANGAVAGIRDRPLVLKRFVNGAEEEPFYQKRAPEKRPEWLRTVTLSFPSGRTAEEIVVDDAGGSRVGREPRLHRAASTRRSRRRSRSSRRASHRSRPWAGRRVG